MERDRGPTRGVRAVFEARAVNLPRRVMTARRFFSNG